mgnify:CR=1 FL=1
MSGNSQEIKSSDRRSLKIQPKYVPRSVRYQIVPEIKLTGKWLSQYGFMVNERVEIYCERGKLVIVPEKNKPTTQ